MRYLFLLISINLFVTIFASGQCPDRDWLWKRLVFLRDSPSTLSQTQKLNELLSYEGKIKECSYKFDSTHALLMQRIGATYFLLSDYLKATSYTQQAINIIQANSTKHSVNIRHNIKNYYNLGWFYDSLGNVIEKMRAFDSSISLAMRLNSPDLYCVRSLMFKVEHSFDVGDYQRCINYSTLLENVSRQYANNENKELGLQYMLTGLFWKVNALIKFKAYKSAEDLLTNKIGECKKTGLQTYLGTIYQQLADLQVQKGNYQQAILNYNLAFNYEREAKDSVSCMVILSNMGYDVYFKRLNNVENAIRYCQNALEYRDKRKSKTSSSTFQSLNVLNHLGSLYAHKGLFDSTFIYFQLALNRIRPGMKEEALLSSSLEDFSKHRNMHYLSDLLLNKGDAFKQKYRSNGDRQALNQAVKTYKIADRLLDRIKLEQTELESKLLWRSDSRRLYENAVDACYLQGNTDDAFYFFEKSRAVLLNDQLNEQRWLGQADILRQSQLKKQILVKEREFNTADRSSNQYDELEKEIFTKKQELESLRQHIKENNPLYYQSFLDSNSFNIATIKQNLLKDDQALIEILSGDSAVYVLVITTQKSHLQKVDKHHFDSLSAAYISYVSDPTLLNKSFESFAYISSQLYHLIFRGISLPGKRLIVSLDNRYFPFEALITKVRPLTYFVEDHAICYTYSARYLMNNFTSGPDFRANTFMGVAPVQFSSDMHLASLWGSDKSLLRMRQYFGNATNLTGAAASRNNFLNGYYKYRIIQLYTHATDSGYGDEPMIYFSDSVLSLNDLIYQNRPVTSLIVLAACQTGSGRLYNGEGVFSFNRQFAALGIPSSVANLWQADNQSSYSVTELFYKYLAKGLPLDVALQRAKKEFIEKAEFQEKKLPYFWAAPILVGQTNSIMVQESSWQWLLVIVFLLLVAIGIEGRVLNKLKPTR